MTFLTTHQIESVVQGQHGLVARRRAGGARDVQLEVVPVPIVHQHLLHPRQGGVLAPLEAHYHTAAAQLETGQGRGWDGRNGGQGGSRDMGWEKAGRGGRQKTSESHATRLLYKYFLPSQTLLISLYNKYYPTKWDSI